MHKGMRVGSRMDRCMLDVSAAMDCIYGCMACVTQLLTHLKHFPGLVRPARPALWCALARLMGETSRLSTLTRGLYTCSAKKCHTSQH
jgi:hypothetical protein